MHATRAEEALVEACRRLPAQGRAHKGADGRGVKMKKAAGSISSGLPGSKYLGQSKQAQPRYFPANRGAAGLWSPNHLFHGRNKKVVAAATHTPLSAAWH
jgi:hypothetical protein